MQADAQKYALRGVSANKTDVHNAIQNLDKGLYPTAFCKILPDFAAADPDYCNIMHADTAGTKTSLAYMYWRETGDLSVWKGIVQDSIVMNLDDMACVGCVNDIILSSTIGRNKSLISGDVVKTLIEATVEFTDKMREFGIPIHLAGGETAAGSLEHPTKMKLNRPTLSPPNARSGIFMIASSLANYRQPCPHDRPIRLSAMIQTDRDDVPQTEGLIATTKYRSRN